MWGHKMVDPCKCPPLIKQIVLCRDVPICNMKFNQEMLRSQKQHQKDKEMHIKLKIF